MNKIEIENNYYNYKFDIYKVEVGVLWTKDEESVSEFLTGWLFI